MKKPPKKSKSKPAPVAEKQKKAAQKKHEEINELAVFELAPPPHLDSGNAVSIEEYNKQYPFDPQFVIGKINAFYTYRYISKAYALFNLAVGVIRELERLEQVDRSGVLTVARESLTWPVLGGRHSAIQKKNMTLFDRLELGRDAAPEIKRSEIPINVTPAKKWALALIKLVEQIRFKVWTSEVTFLVQRPNQMEEQHLERLQRNLSRVTQSLFPSVKLNWLLVFEIGKLPVLAPNEESIKAWQSAVGNFLRLNFDEHPEAIPDLCALGEPRRYSPMLKSVMADDMAKHFVPIEKQQKNIANEVRSKINEEISKIARHLQKLKPPTE